MSQSDSDNANQHPSAAAERAEADQSSAPLQKERLQYVFGGELPDLLQQLGISLVVSTYQAGKLMIVRSRGGRINTLIRNFPQPMGVALRDDVMAFGARDRIWFLQNSPEIAAQLDPPGTHDACYVPRSSHITGDIRVHEMQWVDDELLIVNTRFSCLCKLDQDYSFVPTWRPPFVTAYAAEDRCHLNGMAVEAGQLKYLTALGTTDTAGGWRDHKADGGVLMNYPDGEVIASGFAMPHSPRIYGGHLWILDSGTGSLRIVDPQTGKHEVIARFPGFVRGLAFHDKYAFVGSSKIRESSTFSGVPIEAIRDQLKAGVFVVDIVTGTTVGFIEYTSGCHELFDVQVLADLRWPSVIGFEQDTINGIFIIPPEFHGEVQSPAAQQGSAAGN